MARALKNGDLDEWRRGRAVLGYIEGKRVVELAELLDGPHIPTRGERSERGLVFIAIKGGI